MTLNDGAQNSRIVMVVKIMLFSKEKIIFIHEDKIFYYVNIMSYSLTSISAGNETEHPIISFISDILYAQNKTFLKVKSFPWSYNKEL